MLNFTRALTPVSMARYGYWRLTHGTEPVPLKLRTGVKFLVRPGRTENGDLGVAYEVFINEDYHPPNGLDRDAVRLVIDIGGNVGYSVLYWLNLFPNCTAEVFEPHPLHVAQMHRNLAVSGMQQRVTVHGAAAGASNRAVSISKHGTSSSTLIETDDAFPTEMVDILASLQHRRIDIFKLDAEGGEYEILGDDRFGQLDIGYFVMEWHSRGNGDADRQWCEQRLIGMGYTIQTRFSEPDHGMFWATRAAPAG